MKTRTAHLAIRPDLNISDREVLDKRVGLYNLLSLGPARFAAHHFVLRCARDPAFAAHRNSFYAVKNGSYAGAVWRVQQDFRGAGAQGWQASTAATHLKTHRIAASLLKKGLFPDVSGGPKAA